VALARSEMAAAYPLPAYNFRVDLDGISMGFAEVSGIALARDTLTYRHGLSYWEGESLQTFRANRYIPVSLKQGMVRGITALYDWLNAAGEARRGVAVHLCDAAGQPVVTWHIAKAVAVKIEAPAFNPNANEVAIETLEILAAGISLQHH
jgi:phage tail-like protein